LRTKNLLFLDVAAPILRCELFTENPRRLEGGGGPRILALADSHSSASIMLCLRPHPEIGLSYTYISNLHWNLSLSLRGLEETEFCRRMAGSSCRRLHINRFTIFPGHLLRRPERPAQGPRLLRYGGCLSSSCQRRL